MKYLILALRVSNQCIYNSTCVRNINQTMIWSYYSNINTRYFLFCLLSNVESYDRLNKVPVYSRPNAHWMLFGIRKKTVCFLFILFSGANDDVSNFSPVLVIPECCLLFSNGLWDVPMILYCILYKKINIIYAFQYSRIVRVLGADYLDKPPFQYVLEHNKSSNL